MNRCVAIIGQPAVGKSELTNRLASLEDCPIPAIEASDLRCVPFTYLGEDWTALDCPGSLEFAQSAVDAMLAADAAIVVVSPNPDQAVLAAPWIRLVERSRTPHILFINRMDECDSSIRDIISALQAYSKRPLILRQVPIRDKNSIVGAVDLVSERAWKYRDDGPSELVEIPEDILEREAEGREQMLENLSDHDDWLLEEIIVERTPAVGAVYGICSRVLAENAAVPGFFGAAASDAGTRRLMKALRHEAPDPAVTRSRLGDPDASAFMGRTRKHIGKLVWLRNFADDLEPGASLGGGAIGSFVQAHGERPAAVRNLISGGVASAVKCDHLMASQLYVKDATIDLPDWHESLKPVWTRAITAKHDRDDAKLSEALPKLSADDRSLHVMHDQESGQIMLGTQGAQHLKRTCNILESIFGVATVDGPVTGGYRETITRTTDIHFRHKKQSGGAGQFADVQLTVKPSPRGSGFSFTDTIHGGSVPKNYIPAVRHGAEEALARGPLGFPVVDVSVNLFDGKQHSVDSSDMAFRIAGRGGTVQALGEAQPVLLEPIYLVRFQAPSVFTGALNPMISSLRGQILGFDRDSETEGWDEVRAMMPGDALASLINDLRSVTQGLGRFDAEFSVYQELYGRTADDVIAQRAAKTKTH